ncbi:LruC domain-containing protein [Mucilaginibacter sp. E4BP6]|uniref:LruC domain-containing protein n=1 Tax=Mucilaginibacter sp. E4BP6 TaxID=2723089 RepID=UPI0015C8A783|nr:LruC domain-containing protein [Mucilaginibacter sp. E4BP6]NYE67381.1 LruC domain-containing protein [Mucilaginibacter sp. E4BP6]
MKIFNFLVVSALSCAVTSQVAFAQTAPSLGASQSFAVLAYSTVTNTGNTVVTGDIGVSPGSAITGFNMPGVYTGTFYSGAPTLAGNAQTAAQAAYTNIATQTTTTDLTGQDLGGMTLKPGVYNFSSSAGLTGTLTLDDSADPNGVFIFKMGSTITTASYSKVVMKSGGKGPNVYWQVGSSATVGTYTTFVGNIIATASITMTTGATTTGRLFALNGAVTMDDNTAYASVSQITDTDGDGVADNLDDYPNDPKKAYNNYSSTSGSTVAFEDQWPKIGDFDMNDLIMAYKYNVVTNAQNVVVQVIGYYTLRATGGTLGSAFGVEFPIPSSSVDSLTGGTLEAGQTHAVVMVFANMRDETQNWNTIPGITPSAPLNYTVKFNVVNGPTLSAFGTEYNPFIYNMVGGSREEVHLPGQLPTDLADKTLFGTGDDNTNVAAGTYYVTKTGLPYALSVPGSGFIYPIEGTDITKVYLHFADWAQSGGSLFTDWYSNTAVGYRNVSLLFIQ